MARLAARALVARQPAALEPALEAVAALLHHKLKPAQARACT
ncbi:MAG TPA: hypothetical protein VJV58_14835 [Bradyrhizobium sp.]|nr:hypothetical protein [Bradyrhizobium sp.]HKO72201.1 hypothetical protein [Bradyrhizobium sp.]